MSRAAMKQALRAIQELNGITMSHWQATGLNLAEKALEAAVAESEPEPADRGPWTVSEWKQSGRIVLQSDDFTHDVALIIDGDFSGHDEKLAYARRLAAQFNATPPQRKPLTDGQLVEILRLKNWIHALVPHVSPKQQQEHCADLIELARAVERAHGIE